MKKSVKRMGTEAMCWEMVQIEFNLEACQTFKTTFLHTIQQMPLDCLEVSGAIMSAMHKVENDQRERMARLELEQARLERDFIFADRHAPVLLSPVGEVGVM